MRKNIIQYKKLYFRNTIWIIIVTIQSLLYFNMFIVGSSQEK